MFYSFTSCFPLRKLWNRNRKWKLLHNILTQFITTGTYFLFPDELFINIYFCIYKRFVILVYDQYLPRLLKLINWSQFNIHCFLCSCFTPVLQENPSHLSYFSVCIWHIKSYHKCMVFYEELAFPQYRNLRQNVSKCIGRNEINSYRVYSM